jgi:hypothetical protein
MNLRNMETKSDLYFINQKSCVCLLLWWLGRLVRNRRKHPCPNWMYYTFHTFLRSVAQEALEDVRIASPQTDIRTHDFFNTNQQCSSYGD